MPTKLDDDQVQERLKGLDGWTLDDGKLLKEFRFPDFITAWGWMSQVALWAEKLDHHPEWFNVYGTVRVHLATHDCDGISALDFELAAKMDALA